MNEVTAIGGERKIWRVLVPDLLNPDAIRNVLVAHGGSPIRSTDGFEKLFAARREGKLAIVHEVPNVASTWTVSSDEPWFAELSSFEREYLSFAVRFSLGTLGTSRKPFFRLLFCAATIDGDLDLDNDDEISRAWEYLSGVEQRIGVRLQDVPSLAELDPALFHMARHCMEVSKLFERKLAGEWSVARIERDMRMIASRGPIGRVLATALGEEHLGRCRELHSRLHAETVEHFGKLAHDACVRLAHQATGLAYQGHPRRRAELTLQGIENALFTALTLDFMDRGLTRKEAVPLACEFLGRTVRGIYAGDESARFNRRNHIRWASKLGRTHH